MKTHQLYALCVVLLFILVLPIPGHSADPPHEIGGVRLGKDISEYPHLEFSKSLKNVVVSNWNGFARGMISYGSCKYPGIIVKTKFKYPDTSEKFYKNILKRYKKNMENRIVFSGIPNHRLTGINKRAHKRAPLYGIQEYES